MNKTKFKRKADMKLNKKDFKDDVRSMVNWLSITRETCKTQEEWFDLIDKQSTELFKKTELCLYEAFKKALNIYNNNISI